MLSIPRLAVLRYDTPDYAVLTPGDHVRCAVTGEPIPLRNLKYWSVEHQEAYRGAAECFAAAQAGGAARLKK